MQVKGQSNGCVFTELLTYFHVAVVFFVKNGSFLHFVRKCFLHINSKISRRDDTKTGVICHNTIISWFSKPMTNRLCFMYFSRKALGFASYFTQDFMWNLSWNELSLLWVFLTCLALPSLRLASSNIPKHPQSQTCQDYLKWISSAEDFIEECTFCW